MEKNLILKNNFKDSLTLLSKLQLKKREFIIVLTSSIVTVFFEVFGIGILFPIVETITKNKPEISFLGINLNLENLKGDYLYYYIFGFILLVVGIKFIVVFFNSLFIARFWNSVNEKLTLNIFQNILNSDLNEYIKKSNATYQNLIILEIEKFSELIKAQIGLIVESIILCLIVLLVFYYDFYSALISTFFLGFGFILFYKVSKIFISRWGKKRYYFQDILQNDVKSGLMSYLSIKINGGFNFFLRNVENTLSKRNKYIKRQKVFQNIPRAFIEFNSIFGLVFSTYFLYKYLGLSKNEIINFLTILVVSLTRILPSISRIVTSLNEISFYSEVTNSLLQYLNYFKRKLKKLKLKNSIQGKNISFGFNKKNLIIENLNFEYNIKEVLGIYGKSGVGKSTLTKLILGLISPVKGKIYYDNAEIRTPLMFDINSVFGYVEQNVRIFQGTVLQNIIIDDSLYKTDFEHYSKVLKSCELIEFAATKHDIILQEEGLNISGGQKQRIGLARALFKKPKILVLDEFTSSLDDENKNLIIKSLNKIKLEWKIGIILISHDKSLKSICDKIIELE